MGMLHASIVNTIPDVQLSALYDKNSLVVRFASKTFTDICVTDNLERFSDLSLDAVYVTTPIPTHYSILKAIYSIGMARNLFVEKTLASSYEQAAKLCQEAKAAGGVTMVGYMSRFAPTFKKVKALLQEEAIDKILSFKAYAYASDFENTKVRASSIKGGATRDLGAHVIDLSLWFFGDLEVKPTTPETSAVEITDSGSCFKVRNSNGLIGEFDISWSKAGYRLPEFGLSIRGSKGVITVNSDFVKLERIGMENTTLYRQNLNDRVPFLLGASEYYREDEHFLNSVLQDGSAVPDFSTASKVDLLIDQVEHLMVA